MWMDKKNEQDGTHVVQGPGYPAFTKKIGTTTYEVYIHFSETSTETMSDKIKRLIQQDCTKFP
jgi:hypothetical protein